MHRRGDIISASVRQLYHLLYTNNLIKQIEVARLMSSFPDAAGAVDGR